jgi:hypothetical protein
MNLNQHIKELEAELKEAIDKRNHLKRERFQAEPKAGTVIKYRRDEGSVGVAIRDGQDWISTGAFVGDWDSFKRFLGHKQAWIMTTKTELPRMGEFTF